MQYAVVNFDMSDLFHYTYLVYFRRQKHLQKFCSVMRCIKTAINNIAIGNVFVIAKIIKSL